MDPASITGLVFTVGQIISLLRSYGTAVKGYKEDVRTLLQEAFALKGVLESLADIRQPTHSSHESSGLEAEAKVMIEMTRTTLEAMETRLSAPIGRMDTAKRALAWPFVKADFDRYIALLERSKTWFIACMMNDSSRLTQKIHEDVSKLTEAVQQDMEKRKEDQFSQEVQAIIQQIAPVLPYDHLGKFSKIRFPGSGTWFFNPTFRRWQAGLGPALIWTVGKCRSQLALFNFEILMDTSWLWKDCPVVSFYCRRLKPPIIDD
jgi:hypothetical protein